MGTVGGAYNIGPVHISGDYWTFGGTAPSKDGTVKYNGSSLQVYYGGQWNEIATVEGLGTGWKGEVANYAALPTATGSGDVYLVIASTGFLWNKRKGLYRDEGTWERLANPTFQVQDNEAKFVDNGDNTKIMDFELSSITTGNTRTLTMADRDLDLASPIVDSITVVGGDISISSLLRNDIYMYRSATTITAAQKIGRLSFGGLGGLAGGAGVPVLARIQGVASENWSDGNGGTKLEFHVTPNGTEEDELSVTINEDQSVIFENDIIVPKTAGKGMKVDTTTPTFGWKDLLGKIQLHTPGGNDPTYNTYKGGIKAFEFNAVGDEVFIEFHIPHDYVPGSDLFIHAHWSHTNATTITSGSLTWDFEMTYASGYGVDPFGANVTPTVSHNAATTNVPRYQHMISEVQMSATSPSATQIDSDDIEIDGLILVRVSLTANTLGQNPYLHFVDIHYQSTNIPTKDKNTPFYT